MFRRRPSLAQYKDLPPEVIATIEENKTKRDEQRTRRTENRWNNARQPLIALAGGGSVTYSVTVFDTDAINLLAFVLLFVLAVVFAGKYFFDRHQKERLRTRLHNLEVDDRKIRDAAGVSADTPVEEIINEMRTKS